MRKSKYNRELVIKLILNFVKDSGRLPFKQELIRINKPIRKYFGTWNNAIKVAGFDPNPVMFARKYTANDGHKCDSLSEKIIDDWLYMKRVKHIRNSPYPGKLGLKVDFKVKEYWIEFFGLSGELRRYNELKDSKLKIAKKEKIKLISIYPKDLFPQNKLPKILSKILY